MHSAYLRELENNNYLSLIQRGLEWIQFESLLPSSGARVFIKPNLTFPTYRPGVMTSPEAIEAAILAIREYTPNIILGDADSGGYNRFSMSEVYKETGIADFAQRHGVSVVNLSDGPRKPVEFRYKRKNLKIELPTLLTDEIDLLVTMPVPKVHANTTVSLSFKNQWGCIPEPTDRLRLHPYLERVLVEVNKAVKSQVVIMDGKYGLNNNGPMLGDPVDLNWVMVTSDIGSAARIACELMQIKLNEVKHLRYADRGYRLIPQLDEIALNQPLESFKKTKFVLKRKLTDYPGYLAFNSAFLAYIGYFSPLAGILHKLLYLVREPFYDYEQHKPNNVSTAK